MDSSFVWILMFAGAAVALLGLFLVASERELKTKRREIEALLLKLENTGIDSPAGRPADLQAAHRAAEFSAPSDSDQGQMQDGDAGLQAEIATLRRTLDTRQARVQELEAAQRKLPDIEMIEAEHQRDRQSLHERIADLEARLLAHQETVSDSQTMRERLAEAETVQASLQEQIRRHDAEIPLWQTRIAAAEEHGQRLAALQRPFNELLSKQTALVEEQRRFQEKLAGLVQLVEAPAPANLPVPSARVATLGVNGAETRSQALIGAAAEVVTAHAEITLPK